jgi:flagellin-like hook-associated protein FlgL
MRRWSLTLLTIGVLCIAAAAPAVALADLAPPWNGQPVSHGIGPTYGEPWPVAPPADEAISALQGAPLAVMPYADIGPILQQIQNEAAAAGIPRRMTWWVTGKSAGGRDMYAVEINALETGAQTRDYAHWQTIRRFSLTDPAHAQQQLAAFGDKVKMPIYIEADINGTEYEGTDAMMQVIRDLATTPYGQNPTIDKLLDHCVLVVVPTANPDGRVMGIRGNAAVADTNRDYFLQSQPEEQIDAALQQEFLAPGALHMHGYVTPTLIDGLTIPHNPALQYDIFAKWNQARTAQNKADFHAMGLEIQRPVNDYDANGNYLATGHSTQRSMVSNGATEVGTTVTITTGSRNTPAPHNLSVGDVVTIAGVGAFYGGYNGTFTVTSVPTPTSFTYETTPGLITPSGGGYVWTAAYGAGNAPGPAVAQSWDDWGPFYGQTYMAFLGVDSSTVEMSSQTRLVSKTAQYMAFYSSANFWLDNRRAMFNDQLEMFRRGAVNAPLNPLAIAGVPSLVALGFTDAVHNWMVDYPKAYVIPFGKGQRSDAEANRLVQWLLVNNVRVERAKQDFTWKGTTFQAGSYVVPMNQALRGLAWDALAGGTDIEGRISILYASPAAWSHGLVWGADTIEVPRADAKFAPKTQSVSAVNAVAGGIRGGVSAKADWYSVTLKGVRQDQAILGVLKSGVHAELAEAPFTSTTGGSMPAGSLIFPADRATAAALDAAGKQAGLWVERTVGLAKPATTKVNESPKIAILTNTGTPTKTIGPTTYVTGADTDGVLTRLFGSDAQYVGTNALASSTTDPLAGFDVIVNAGASWPSNTIAQGRLNDFFAHGGGYIGVDSASASNTANFSFLTSAGLVAGLARANQSAYGGIAVWNNVGGAASPLTGAYPGSDFMFLPSIITYFSAVPAGAAVDGQYPASIATVGPKNGFVAGMWLDRSAAANSAPVLVRGLTTKSSRYVAYATNPFSRYDAEREWPLVVQAALWTNLTDE